MHNKSVSDVASYNGPDDSTNFKTAQKHAAYTLSKTYFNFIILFYSTHCIHIGTCPTAMHHLA